MILPVIFCAIGLVSGNYIYQAFGVGDWAAAHERSIFQIVAIVALWITYHATKTT